MDWGGGIASKHHKDAGTSHMIQGCIWLLAGKGLAVCLKQGGQQLQHHRQEALDLDIYMQRE